MVDDSSLRAVGWARSLPLSSRTKTARDWTRARLTTLGWQQTAPETVDAVVLTVSELVTNAHRHGCGAAQLVLTWDHECLHVTVHDPSPQLPRVRLPADDTVGGRGMFLVDALADTWEVRPCPNGKDVTACFRPPASPAAAAGESAGAPGRG